MRSLALATAATLATVVVTAPARAALVDLAPYVDNDISGYTDGSAYPAPGVATVGGVQFLLAGFGGGTGIIRGPANTPVTIAIGQTGVASVYLIVNSADGGQTGSDVGSIVFNGTNAATETVDLIEGTNIRDHYSGAFNNATGNLYATENYPGGAHFDVYRYDLPTFAGQTLTSNLVHVEGTGLPLWVAVHRRRHDRGRGSRAGDVGDDDRRSRSGRRHHAPRPSAGSSVGERDDRGLTPEAEPSIERSTALFPAWTAL